MGSSFGSDSVFIALMFESAIKTTGFMLIGLE